MVLGCSMILALLDILGVGSTDLFSSSTITSSKHPLQDLQCSSVFKNHAVFFSGIHFNENLRTSKLVPTTT